MIIATLASAAVAASLSSGRPIQADEQNRTAAAPPTTSPASPAASQPSTQTSTQPDAAFEVVRIAGEDFRLQIAGTEAAREQGLMHRDHIDEHGGMLFVWPTAELRSFWMKHCPIDIDVAFLDSAGTIVALHAMQTERAQRPTESTTAYEARLKLYSSRRAAQYAIELRAGSIARLKLKVGQRIDLDHERLREYVNDEAEPDRE